MKMTRAMEARIIELAGIAGVEPKRTVIPDSIGNVAFSASAAGLHGSARFVVTIERWHPTRLNTLLGSHHMRAGQLKKIDSELVAEACHRAGVTQAIGKRRVQLTIILGKGQRPGDPDAYHKSLHDALVNCGALKDDSERWLELCPPVFVKADERASRIVIEGIEQERN